MQSFIAWIEKNGYGKSSPGNLLLPHLIMTMPFRKQVILLLIFIILFFPGSGFTDEENRQDVLAVLDLVDLSYNETLPEITFQLRNRLDNLKHWSVIASEDQLKIYEKYQKNAQDACNDPQCAFELGGALQANYVLFGTATAYYDYGLFTFKLLNVSKARVIWTMALSSISGSAEIESVFRAVKKDLAMLKPNRDLGKAQKKILAILEYGTSSMQSKILYEQILTHAYNLKAFDIMSPTEVKELITILEIRKPSMELAGRTMWQIGKKMGVNCILFSDFRSRGLYYKHSMALFDIDKKTVTLSMPPVKMDSFREMMKMENSFFTAAGQLYEISKSDASIARQKVFRK